MIKIREKCFLKEKLMVHRGVYDNEKKIPENTLPAFEKAVELGYGIELDVHILKDSTVVVFHDDNLKRAANIPKEIKDYTYKELKEIPIFNSKQIIPTLEEVLRLIKGRVGVLIELKYDQKIGKLENELVKLLDSYRGKFAVQSFDPFRMHWMKKNRPDYIRGQLVTNLDGKIENYFMEKLLINPWTDVDFVSSNLTLVKDTNIQKIRQKKLLLGWTVENEEERKQYIPYCDNFIMRKKD